MAVTRGSSSSTSISSAMPSCAWLPTDAISVSYTHLDVYKRQSLYWGFGFIAACYLAYYVVRRRQPQGLGDPALGRAG